MLKPEVFALPESRNGTCCFCKQHYRQEHVVVVLFTGNSVVGDVCLHCLSVRYPATFVKALRAARAVLETQDPTLTEEDLDAYDKRQFRESSAGDPCETVTAGPTPG